MFTDREIKENAPNVAIIFVGIPGSGKTTFRQRAQVVLPNARVISSDDFIELYAATHKSTYNNVFKEAVKLAQEHVNLQFERAIANNEDIIWDQTNLTIEKRKKILKRLPSHYKAIAVFVNTALDCAIERNARRERSIPEHVIYNMYNTLEPPTREEGFAVVMTTS